MKIDTTLGSAFDCLSEPSETYREGCFSFQKWVFDTESQDIKWVLLRREFMTLSEQAFEWIDRFDFPETLKLDAKRIIWDVKYEDYKRGMGGNFSSPIVIALCALNAICTMKNFDFFSRWSDCLSVIKTNIRGRKLLLQSNIMNDRSAKERINMKTRQLLGIISQEKIEMLKKMWGCMDEATLYA